HKIDTGPAQDRVACCGAPGGITVNGKPLSESYLYPGDAPSRMSCSAALPVSGGGAAAGASATSGLMTARRTRGGSGPRPRGRGSHRISPPPDGRAAALGGSLYRVVYDPTAVRTSPAPAGTSATACCRGLSAVDRHHGPGDERELLRTEPEHDLRPLRRGTGPWHRRGKACLPLCLGSGGRKVMGQDGAGRHDIYPDALVRVVKRGD